MPQSVVISCVDNLPGKASLAEGGWWKERGGLGGDGACEVMRAAKGPGPLQDVFRTGG